MHFVTPVAFIRWRFGVVGSDVGQINDVALRRARLVLGWITVSCSIPLAGNLSQSNQPPKSTQPSLPSVDRLNEYRPKAVMLYGWGVKAGWLVFGGR